MRYFPVNLDLKGRPVVVLGGGEVATRKVVSLIESGAHVRVIAPEATRSLRTWARRKRIRLTLRRYRAGDLSRAFAAIAATDDLEVQQKIRAEARRRRVLLNIVDRPEFCDFVFPAKVQRGEFLMTISTGGASPALAKKIREDLEVRFGPEYRTLVELLARLRGRVPPRSREAGVKFNNFVRSPILRLIKRRDLAGVDRLLHRHFGEDLSLKSLGIRW